MLRARINVIAAFAVNWSDLKQENRYENMLNLTSSLLITDLQTGHNGLSRFVSSQMCKHDQQYKCPPKNKITSALLEHLSNSFRLKKYKSNLVFGNLHLVTTGSCAHSKQILHSNLKNKALQNQVTNKLTLIADPPYC